MTPNCVPIAYTSGMAITRPTTPCVPHAGHINARGYGMVGPKLAHRVAWVEVNGPIPDGGTLDHLCHDPEVCKLGDDCPHRRCRALDHLEVVTAAVNRERSGRYNRDKNTCPEGHPYKGNNLLVYDGKRHCRTCRRAKEHARRYAASVARCVAAGHEREEALDTAGRTYCVVCHHARSVAGALIRGAQLRTGKRSKAAAYEAHDRWRQSKRIAACRAKGHERDEVTGPTGHRYCAICKTAPKRKKDPA
jgi:HNH endonuclease